MIYLKRNIGKEDPNDKKESLYGRDKSSYRIGKKKKTRRKAKKKKIQIIDITSITIWNWYNACNFNICMVYIK